MGLVALPSTKIHNEEPILGRDAYPYASMLDAPQRTTLHMDE